MQTCRGKGESEGKPSCYRGPDRGGPSSRLVNRKLIPDLASWTQCFGVYAMVIISKEPERAKHLFVYMSLIAKCSSTSCCGPGGPRSAVKKGLVVSYRGISSCLQSRKTRSVFSAQTHRPWEKQPESFTALSALTRRQGHTCNGGISLQRAGMECR